MYVHPFVPSARAELPALLRSFELDAQPSAVSERVLVPYDGSRAAQRALRHALAKSSPGRVRIDLVNVQPPVMAGDVNPFTSAGAVEERRMALGAEVLRPATLELQAHRVPYTARVALGDIGQEIARSAQRLESTEVVMGTRAMAFLRSLFSRSVSRHVVKLTSVPVTLVKADAAPEAWLPETRIAA